MPYSVFWHTKIHIVKLTNRLNRVFHRAVTFNKKAVSLSYFIIWTSEIVTGFPGEDLVLCGFHFLAFFPKGKVSEILLLQVLNILKNFCIWYLCYWRQGKNAPWSFRGNMVTFQEVMKSQATFFSFILDQSTDLSHDQIHFPFVMNNPTAILCLCIFIYVFYINI